MKGGWEKSLTGARNGGRDAMLLLPSLLGIPSIQNNHPHPHPSLMDGPVDEQLAGAISSGIASLPPFKQKQREV
jgi:hypothetical protein